MPTIISFGVKVEIQFKGTVNKGANYYYIGNYITIYSVWNKHVFFKNIKTFEAIYL